MRILSISFLSKAMTFADILAHKSPDVQTPKHRYTVACHTPKRVFPAAFPYYLMTQPLTAFSKDFSSCCFSDTYKEQKYKAHILK